MKAKSNRNPKFTGMNFLHPTPRECNRDVIRVSGLSLTCSNQRGYQNVPWVLNTLRQTS